MKKKVIIRGDRSGVFFGTLESRTGGEVSIEADSLTVIEFIELTKDSYRGEIIKMSL